MKLFIIQSKGGVGKSFLTAMLYLISEKHLSKKMVVFGDCDNETASTNSFFLKIKERKSENIKSTNFYLLDEDKKIDRTKIEELLFQIQSIENIVLDFGAASSTELVNYIIFNPEIVPILKAAKIQFVVVVNGGAQAQRGIEFLNKVKGIPEFGSMLNVVANEAAGQITGKSVKDYINADFSLPLFHKETGWNEKMQTYLSEGLAYADIKDVTAPSERFNQMDKIRIHTFIDSLEKEFNPLLEK